MTVHKKDLRISRDWFDDTWISIKEKPDITPTILTSDSFNTNLSLSPSMAKDENSNGFANSCHDIPASEKSNEVDIFEEKLVCSDIAEDEVCLQNDNSPSEKNTQVGDIEDNGCNDDKDNSENDDNRNDYSDNRDVEVIGTSGVDCKGAQAQLMEVAV